MDDQCDTEGDTSRRQAGVVPFERRFSIAHQTETGSDIDPTGRKVPWGRQVRVPQAAGERRSGLRNWEREDAD